MAELSLKIKADFDAAQASFKRLATEADAAGMSIKQFTKEFADKGADQFIAKQQVAGAAVRAVRGDLAAMTSQQQAYGREIERLIKAGIDPESTAIKRLQTEYTGLTKKIEDETAARKRQENSWKIAAGLLAGLATGVGLFVGATIKSAAAIEDMTAAFTPMMGSTEKAAELVNRLNKEAVTTPFALDNISNSVRRLLPAFEGDMDEAIKAFRLIGDTAGGNAQSLETMTRAYSNVKMTGKASLENLNQIANAGVPIFTELAKSQGKTVAEIRQMTSDGKISAGVLTDTFRTMTSEGGLFYKGMETSAFTFNSTILGIQENISLVAGKIGEKFLPIAQEVADTIAEWISSFYEWISQGDNLTDLLETLAWGIGIVGAALGTFLIINTITKAVWALNAAMAANPIGAIVAGVVALGVGIAAISSHAEKMANRYADTHKAIDETAESAKSMLEAFAQGNEEKAIDQETSDKLIELYPELTDRITANTTTVRDAVAAYKELVVQKKIDAEQGRIAELRERQRALRAYNDELRASEKLLRERRAEVEAGIREPWELEHLENEIAMLTAQTNRDAETIFALVDDINRVLGEVGKGITLVDWHGIIDIPITVSPPDPAELEDAAGTTVKVIEGTLQERLSQIQLNPTQALNEMVEQVKSFLSERAELEGADGTSRAAFYEQQGRSLIETANFTAEEMLAIERAVAESTAEIMNETNVVAEQTLQQRLEAMGQTVRQAEEERRDIVTSFAAERLAAENLEGQARIEYLKQQQAYVLSNFEQGSLEYLSAQAAFNQMIEEEDRRSQEARRQMITETLSTTLSAFNSFAEASLTSQKEHLSEKLATFDANAKTELENENLNEEQKTEIRKRQEEERQKIIDESNKKARAAAIAQRVLANAEAVIQTYLAASKAFADFGGWPLGLPAMAATILAGMANVTKINTTPIPSLSAETGGRFIVPDTSPRVDSTYMRVNANEQIDVTPAGQTSSTGGTQTFNLVFDGQVLASAINKLARAGELNTLQLAGNL